MKYFLKDPNKEAKRAILIACCPHFRDVQKIIDKRERVCYCILIITGRSEEPGKGVKTYEKTNHGS